MRSAVEKFQALSGQTAIRQFGGILVLLGLLVPAYVQASSLYYDDGTVTDLVSDIFDGEGCAGCHAGSTSCTGGPSQTDFLSYSTAAACIANIRDKVSSMPSYGARMPTTGCCLSGAQETRLSTWDTNGEPLSPANASGLFENSITRTSATINATIDTNVWSGTAVAGTYTIEWGPTTSYGNVVASGNQSSTASSARSGGTGSVLACNTTYFTRATATNGAGSDSVTGSFTTLACTPPVITQGASTGVVMSEDSSPTPFSLTLNATDDDAGTLSWTIFSQGSNGTAGIAGGGTGTSEPISYTPTLNYTGADSFQVRVTNLTTSQTDTITVNVTINPVNDPPVITQGAGPLAQVIDEDNSPTAFSLTLNATDNDTAAGSLIWSISSGPGNGLASPAGDGVGLSEAISYTPTMNYNGADSFTVQVFDGSSSDTIIVNVTINPRNDPPVISAVGSPVGTEGVLVTIAPVVTDPDDLNNGTELMWSFVAPLPPAWLSISPTGVVSGTPPLGPPAVFDQMYPITIRVQDGGEHGAGPDDESFMLEIDPPDGDSDLVADYDDLCLTVPSVILGQNLDNDTDGVPGADGDITSPFGVANTGGDVCDLDDDNDGMPDVFEIAEGFDPFDAADAAQDADGDGVSNLQEFLDGTNPNFANIFIDATGYLTPYTLPQPDPTTVHPMATSATPDDPGPYRPGRNTIVWTGANISNANLGTSNQTLDIRPLVSFAADQQAEEGVAVTVDVSLNGDPPSYPVTVNYTVSGTANNPTDHDAVSGALVFNTPDLSETIVFNTQADALTDPNETVVFTIDSASNAAVGSNNTHRVTIVEANVAPEISIQFNQGGNPVSSVYAADGNMDISVIVTDVNVGQTHVYDWSGSNNTLTNPGNVPTWGAFAPPAVGNYLIDIVVTDAGAPLPSASTRVSRILNVVAGSAPQGPDDDDDGVPNNVDPFDSSAGGDPSNLNLIPDQTVNNLTTQIVQTDPGLKITVGNTAQSANQFGILLTNDDIAMYGSGIGTPPLNPDDNFQHFGGVYDFEIRGIMPGQSANVVIPLLSAIPRNAEYRKFNPATGWGSFVINGNNSVSSASGESGACPEPGSIDYVNGLNYLDNCLQLTIQDGGPNDTDNLTNGIISDPGTIGAQLTDPQDEEVESGSSRIAPSLLLIMLLLTLINQRWRLGRGPSV